MQLFESAFRHRRRCQGRRATTATTLLSLLALLAPHIATTASSNPYPIHEQLPLLPPEFPNTSPPPLPAPVLAPTPEELSFRLRHVFHHGTFKYPHLLRRLDVKPTSKFWVTSEGSPPEAVPILKAKSYIHPIQRLVNRDREVIEQYLFLSRHGWAQSYTADAWSVDEIPQPNITDKETVVTLAKMTADAYVEIPGAEDWVDVGPHWNVTDDFGWDGDGLRGHIFVDEKNTTLVIGLKGTSPAVFDGPETTTNDKINDNLLFSCCCGRVSRWWKTVCDCYSGTAYTCGKTCLKESLMDESRYYMAARNLYYNVTELYPNITNVWLVGHSLGGSVSSLLGQTYGLPVVAYEAPGEALASQRLELPTPPEGVYAREGRGVVHFGHSADPIFMGACKGPTSPCSIGGYAMETRCHAGRVCLYDVVGDKGWRMGLGYHRILPVIKDVLEVYDSVPECVPDVDCVDCFNWKFIDSNQTTTTSAATTTSATSATTTCKTKGWWGCLDEPTTTAADTVTTTSTVATTTTTTVTCTSYGWFGKCLDGVTSTTTTTTGVPSTTSTTCTKYGWLGNCLDGRSSTSTTSFTTPPPATITPPPETGPAEETKTGPTELQPTSTKEKCKHRAWWGGCLDPSETEEPEPEPTTMTSTGGPGDGDGNEGKCKWWEFRCD
ncbi:Alpha/Beta hydrolase protein [Kalaharituber pfeilii]|nr:Alpha/Beta hydrolase protein [Kalaharituber pfeilii]